EVFVGAVMAPSEEAGVHSGVSSCAIPPQTLSDAELDQVEEITRAIARHLPVRGLLNVQLAVKDEQVWMIEANPRASRTVPFVGKATGVSLARVAAQIACGRTISELIETGELPGDQGRY